MSKELIQPKISLFLSKPPSAQKKPEETSLKRKLSDSTAEGDMGDQVTGYKKSYAQATGSSHGSGHGSTYVSYKNPSFQDNDHQNNNQQDKKSNTGRTEGAARMGQNQLSSGSDRERSDLNPSPDIEDKKFNAGRTGGTAWTGQNLVSSGSNRERSDSNPSPDIEGRTERPAWMGQSQRSSGSDRERYGSNSSPSIQENAHTAEDSFHQVQGAKHWKRHNSNPSPDIEDNAHSSHTAEDSFHQGQGAKQGCSKDDDVQRACNTNRPAVPYENTSFWRGVDIKELQRAPKCFKANGMSLPPLKPSKDHKVFFEIPPEGWDDKIPTPHRGKSQGIWDDDHVYMPNSDRNEMPENGRACSRWEKILKTLTGHISDSFDLAEAIIKYNPHYKNRWNFDSLHHFFETNKDPHIKTEFFTNILPEMQKLALRLSELCPMAIPILKQGRNMKLTFSQEQVACLLANAFFCTFPKRNFKSKYCKLPDINFSNLYTDSNDSCRAEKLNCIINYFRRVLKDMPKGTVTYARQHVVDDHDWPKMYKKFSRLHVSTTGTIEDDGWGMLQADFANKYVGGGVLGHGLVQEEIRFVICPEMILSRLFTEVLGDKEVLIMTGCERFSTYEGYSRTFKYSGNYVDNTERDEWGRRYTEVVAMDALVFRGFKTQYEKDKIFRELNKAYCAFSGNQFREHLPAVCTGNWGCGAFGGDKQLKAMIQWMAASAVSRDVCYLTFGDAKLCDQLGQLYSLFTGEDIQIPTVLGFIKGYCDYLKKSGAEQQQSLFQFLACMAGGKLEEPYTAEEISNQDNVGLEDSYEMNSDDQ